MSKITPTFLLIGFALIVWAVGVTLSDKLSVMEAHKQEESEDNPEFANIMQKISFLQKKLGENPKDEEALLEMATLSLEFGVLDKANQYYAKLLEIKPNFFQARLGYALSFHLLGMKVEAKIEAEKAKKIAKTEEEKDKLDKLFTIIENETIDTEKPNPIFEFFNKHPIVGPKLASMAEATTETIEVYLSDFPVDQMPDFAKQKFIGSVKTELNNSDFKLVILKDAKSNETLLEIAKD